MAKFIIILCLTVAAPQPDFYLAPLKKGTELTLKEMPAGYKITIVSPGTHKVVACDPDFVTIIDATGTATIRINKNAVLSITEIKLR